MHARKYQIAVWTLCGMFLLIDLYGCGRIYPYSSSTIEMRFVDNDTGQPLEWVMVLASWSTTTPGIEWIPNITGHGGPQPSCALLANVETATSGVDGVAVLPAWTAHRKCKAMDARQPRIVIYKPGYRMLDLFYDDGHSSQNAILIRSQSAWDGKKTLRLKKLGHGLATDGEDVQIDNLADYISAVFDAATSQVHPTKCYWAEARPAFVTAMREERRLNGYFHDSPNPMFHRGFRLIEQMIDESYAPGFYEIGDFTCGETTTYLKGLLKEVDGTVPENGPLW